MLTLTSKIKLPPLNQKVLTKFQNKEFGFTKLLHQDLTPILDFARKAKGKYGNILVIGIGGSALGGQALIQALKTPYYNHLKNRRDYPKIFFLDTTDPDQIFHLEKLLDLKKTLLIAISKSGETLETVQLFKYFAPKVKDIVIITDSQKGSLFKIAQKKKCQLFVIPKDVGGRFSVLSPVGLVPAALVGIDIPKLIKGALKAQIKPAGTLAQAQFSLDKPITVLFPYALRLEKIADWYTQLLAESLGKTAKIGPTPLKATGPRDQHSLLQLFMDGPNNKFFIFLEVKKFKHHTAGFHKLISAQLKGTRDALIKRKRPCLTLTLPQVNEESIGELLYLFELQVALLGELYGVNAFNQPGVELGKKLTRKYLT